jgi:rRNA maturation endonuclease Nob1
MSEEGTVSLEKMYHFRCVACTRWWSIADAPGTPTEREWYCPWCGLKQAVADKTPKMLS